MTDWRAPLALFAVLALAGGPPRPAAAQQAAGPPAITGPATGPATEPATEPATGGPAVAALPASPEQEAQQRRDQLDELFARLAQADSPGWEDIQAQIWRLWAQSGSASMDLLLQRAAQAMEADDSELALSFLDDLVRLDPEFAEGWNKRATVYFVLGEYGRSVADIEHTLALEPRHFGALSGLGIIMERLGNKEGAMQAYREVLAIHPNMPGAAAGVKRLSAEVDGQAL